MLRRSKETAGAADAKSETKSKTKPPSKSKVQSRTNVYVERARALQDAGVPGQRLLGKPEILAITGTSFPTIWQMMRAGTFPRSRIVGGRSMWLATDIDAWIAGLPVRPLKGDVPLPDEAA
jgi:predicted DNA-binding transcriptional regulator AlpA